MKLRRAPRMPRDLRQVMSELRAIHDVHEPQLQPDDLLDQVRARIEAAVAAGGSDAEIEREIDGYIDTFISGWRATMLARHLRVLNDLDVLEVRVRPYLDRSDALHADEERKLSDLDGAVSHALDRVSDPDTPYIDPLPRQRRWES